MWESTPWFVKNGKHSPALARLLAYAATSGNEGVIEPNDCKVTPLDVPGLGVKVGRGGVLIRNRAAGGGQQTYVGRNPEAEDFTDLSPTTSAGPRSDLIVARVEDPEFPGVPDPDDGYDNHHFIRTAVIEDVPASTRRLQELPGREFDTALTLARIARPANTGTVNASHITDLRALAQTQTRQEMRTWGIPPGTGSGNVQSNLDGERWPLGGNWDILIPEWATHVRLVGHWSQIRIPPGNVLGWLWLRMTGGGLTRDTSMTRYDTPGATSQSRSSFVVADEIAIPAALRGSSVNFAMWARRTGGASSTSAFIVVDDGSSVALQLDFYAKPV